jgi:hypothetical protein
VVFDHSVNRLDAALKGSMQSVMAVEAANKQVLSMCVIGSVECNPSTAVVSGQESYVYDK